MIGGQAVGVRAFVEGAVRIANVFSNEAARKWAAPVLGAFIIGATTYFVLELPSSVPRTIGRRIRKSLVKPEARTETQKELFVDAHAARVARETRKVLRLASWDLRERFRVAMDERSQEVQSAEETERCAILAKEWFTEVGQKTTDIREQAGLVSMS
jgi:mitofusin